MRSERHAVVCLGETMAQVLPVGGPVRDANTFEIHPAGAESNVALALAGLGHDVAWCSRVGDDPLGARVLDAIGAGGVDVTLVERHPSRPTGLFVKEPSTTDRSVTYYRTGSAASTICSDDVRRALAGGPQFIHLTGITPALSDSCDEATQQALEEAPMQGTRTSFDVNLRPSLWPDPSSAANRLLVLARLAGVVLVGLDEAAALWKTRTPDEVRALLPTGELVVKHAPDGVTVWTAGGPEQVATPPVDVCESSGAGDAFAAGYLHGLLLGWPPPRRVQAGHLMAVAALRSRTDVGRRIGSEEVRRQTAIA